MFRLKPCLMLCVMVIVVLAHGAVGQSYKMRWHTVGSGGGSGASEEFRLRYTLGQAVAGTSAGGTYMFATGYWGGAARIAVPGDCNSDSLVQLNDFACFASCFTGPARVAPAECLLFDLDFDSDVDANDYTAFHVQLGK